MDHSVPLPNLGNDEMEMDVSTRLTEDDFNFSSWNSENFFFQPSTSFRNEEPDRFMLDFEVDNRKAGQKAPLGIKDKLLSESSQMYSWLVSPSMPLDFSQDTDFGEDLLCDLLPYAKESSPSTVQSAENPVPGTSSLDGGSVLSRDFDFKWQLPLPSVEESSSSASSSQEDCVDETVDEIELPNLQTDKEEPEPSQDVLPDSSGSLQVTSDIAEICSSSGLVPLSVHINEPGPIPNQTVPVILLVPPDVADMYLTNMNIITQGQTPTVPLFLSALMPSTFPVVTANSSGECADAESQLDGETMQDDADSQMCEDEEAFMPEATQTAAGLTNPASDRVYMKSLRGQSADLPMQKQVLEVFYAPVILNGGDLPDCLENIDLCTAPAENDSISGVVEFGPENQMNLSAQDNTGSEQNTVQVGNITPAFSTMAVSCLPNSCESYNKCSVPVAVPNQAGDQSFVLEAEESFGGKQPHSFDHQLDNSCVDADAEGTSPSQAECGYISVFVPAGILSEDFQWFRIRIPQAHFHSKDDDACTLVSPALDSQLTDSSVENHVMSASSAVNPPCQDSSLSDGATQPATQLPSATDAFIPGHTETCPDRVEDSMEMSTDDTLIEKQMQNTGNSIPSLAEGEVEGQGDNLVSSSRQGKREAKRTELVGRNSIPSLAEGDVEGQGDNLVSSSKQGKRKAKGTELVGLFPPKLGVHRSSEQEALQTPFHLHQFRDKIFAYPFDKDDHHRSEAEAKTLDRFATALALQSECYSQSQMVKEKIDRMHDAKSVGKLKTSNGDFYCPPNYLQKRTVRQMLQDAGIPDEETVETTSSNTLSSATNYTEVPDKDIGVAVKRKAADFSHDNLQCKKARQDEERNTSGCYVDKFQLDSKEGRHSESPCSDDSTAVEQNKSQFAEVSDNLRNITKRGCDRDELDDSMKQSDNIRKHVELNDSMKHAEKDDSMKHTDSDESMKHSESDENIKQADLDDSIKLISRSSKRKVQEDAEFVEQSADSDCKQRKKSSPSSQKGNGNQNTSSVNTEQNVDVAGLQSCENYNNQIKQREQENQIVKAGVFRYEDESLEHMKESKCTTDIQNKQSLGGVQEGGEATDNSVHQRNKQAVHGETADDSAHQGSRQAVQSFRLPLENEHDAELQNTGKSTALMQQQGQEELHVLNEDSSTCSVPEVPERRVRQNGNDSKGEDGDENAQNDCPSNDSLSEGSDSGDSRHTTNIQTESEHMDIGDQDHPGGICLGNGLKEMVHNSHAGNKLTKINADSENLTEQNINQHDSYPSESFPEEQVSTLQEGVRLAQDVIDREIEIVSNPAKCSPRKADESCAWSLQTACDEDSTVICQYRSGSFGTDPEDLGKPDSDKGLCDIGTEKEETRIEGDIESLPVVEKDGKYISSQAIHDGNVEKLYQTPFVLLVHQSASVVSEKDVHENDTIQNQSQDRNSVTPVEKPVGDEAKDGSIASPQNDQNQESLPNAMKISDVFNIESDADDSLSSTSVINAASENSLAQSSHLSTSSCQEARTEILVSSCSESGRDSEASVANDSVSVPFIPIDVLDNSAVNDDSMQISPESVKQDNSVFETPSNRGQMNPVLPFTGCENLISFDINQIVLPDLHQISYNSLQGHGSDFPRHQPQISNSLRLLDSSAEQGKSTIDKGSEGYSQHVQELDLLDWMQDSSESDSLNRFPTELQVQYSNMKDNCSSIHVNTDHIEGEQVTKEAVLAESSIGISTEQHVCNHSPVDAQSCIWGPKSSANDMVTSIQPEGESEDRKTDSLSLDNENSLDVLLQIMKRHAEEPERNSVQPRLSPPPFQDCHPGEFDGIQPHQLSSPLPQYTHEPAPFNSNCTQSYGTATVDQQAFCETVCNSASGHDAGFPEFVQFGSSVMSSLSLGSQSHLASQDAAQFFRSGQGHIPYADQTLTSDGDGTEIDEFCRIDTNTNVKDPHTCCSGTSSCGCQMNARDLGCLLSSKQLADSSVGSKRGDRLLSSLSNMDSENTVLVNVVPASSEVSLPVKSCGNMSEGCKDSVSTNMEEHCFTEGSIQPVQSITVLPVCSGIVSPTSFSEAHQNNSSPTALSERNPTSLASSKETNHHTFSPIFSEKHQGVSLPMSLSESSSSTSFRKMHQELSLPSSCSERCQEISSPSSLSEKYQHIISSLESINETVQQMSLPSTLREAVQPISSCLAAVNCQDTLIAFSKLSAADSLSVLSCDAENTVPAASLSDLPQCTMSAVQISLSPLSAMVSESVALSKADCLASDNSLAAPNPQKLAVQSELQLSCVEEQSLPPTISQPPVPEIGNEFASSTVSFSNLLAQQETPVKLSSVCPGVTGPASQTDQHGINASDMSSCKAAASVDNLLSLSGLQEACFVGNECSGNAMLVSQKIEQNNENVVTCSSTISAVPDTLEFPTINLADISVSMVQENQQSSAQIMLHTESEPAKSSGNLTRSNKKHARSSEQCLSESKRKCARYSECNLARSRRKSLRSFSTVLSKCSLPSDAASVQTGKSQSSGHALPKTGKKSSKCSDHSDQKFELAAESLENTVLQLSKHQLSRELKSLNLSGFQPSKSKWKSSKISLQVDQNKSKAKEDLCKPNSKRECSESQEQSERSSKKARFGKGVSDDSPSVLSVTAAAAETTNVTVTTSRSGMGACLSTCSRTSRSAGKGTPSTAPGTEESVTFSGRLSPLTVAGLPPLTNWENPLPLTLSSTAVPTPRTSTMKYVVSPVHTNIYHPCPCHPLSVAVGKDRIGPPCLPFNPAFLSCPAMKGVPVLAACPRDLPQNPLWMHDDVYKYSPSAVDIHMAQSRYSKCRNNPPDHHYKECHAKFFIHSLSIGNFTLNIDDKKFGKNSRLCFTFMKRLLYYRLELIQPLEEVGSAGQLVIVEMDLKNVVGVWGGESTLLLHLSHPPHTYIRNKWCRNKTQCPFDISAGEISSVPYHFITFQTSCVRTLKRNLCEHPVFCHMFVQPVTVDLTSTFSSAHLSHARPSQSTCGVSTSPENSHCLQCKENGQDAQWQCQVSEEPVNCSTERDSVQKDGAQKQDTGERDSQTNQGTDKEDSRINQVTAVEEPSIRQGTGEEESGMSRGTAEEQSAMNQCTAKEDTGMKQDTAEKEPEIKLSVGDESGINHDTADKESGMNEGIADNESEMLQSTAALESGIILGNEKEDSGMNQGTVEEESRISQGTAEKELEMSEGTPVKKSQMNQDTSDKESGMNQGSDGKELGMNWGTSDKIPRMNQGTDDQGIGIIQSTAEESEKNKDTAEEESGKNQGIAEQESKRNQGTICKESAMNQGIAQEGTGMIKAIDEEKAGLNQGTAEKESGINPSGRNQGTAEEESGRNQGSAFRESEGTAGMNEGTTEKELGMN